MIQTGYCWPHVTNQAQYNAQFIAPNTLSFDDRDQALVVAHMQKFWVTGTANNNAAMTCATGVYYYEPTDVYRFDIVEQYAVSETVLATFTRTLPGLGYATLDGDGVAAPVDFIEKSPWSGEARYFPLGGEQETPMSLRFVWTGAQYDVWLNMYAGPLNKGLRYMRMDILEADLGGTLTPYRLHLTGDRWQKRFLNGLYDVSMTLRGRQET